MNWSSSQITGDMFAIILLGFALRGILGQQQNADSRFYNPQQQQVQYVYPDPTYTYVKKSPAPSYPEQQVVYEYYPQGAEVVQKDTIVSNNQKTVIDQEDIFKDPTHNTYADQRVVSVYPQTKPETGFVYVDKPTAVSQDGQYYYLVNQPNQQESQQLYLVPAQNYDATSGQTVQGLQQVNDLLLVPDTVPSRFGGIVRHQPQGVSKDSHK